MMMSSYCEELGVECNVVATVVNSPRMKVGLRIKSRTDGLEFTALAARFESKVEEHVLRSVVRLGL